MKTPKDPISGETSPGIKDVGFEDIVEITHDTPYKDINFMGTYLACALGTVASYGGYVMPATSLSLINEDIGPSPNITWVALAWTLTLAVGYTLVGRLSDLFGRRWFFTGSSVLALVGCIVGATAKDVNQLIGANVLIGLSAATQLSFTYVLGELVPVKDRFAVFCGLFIISFPIAGLGPFISRLFIANTAAGWRWNYYFSIIINSVATVLWFFCYHPPTFEHLHKNRSKWQELRDIDIVGIILFTGGLLLFLMGLSWGGQLYPWKSAHVIATMVVGVLMLVTFAVWEIYMPLTRPLIPMHLFKSRDFNIIVIMTTVGGMLYYSMNVIFPSMVDALFTTDIVYGGLVSCAVGGGTCLGQFMGCLIATPGGHIRLKMIIISAMMCAFIGGLAGAGQDQSRASALVVLGSVSVGLLESIGNGIVTIILEDQTEMGAAVGVYGSIRSAGGVLATAVYSTILSNRVRVNTGSIVIPSILDTGLPAASVQPLLVAMSTRNQEAIASIPGITEKTIDIAAAALKLAYSKAFQTVFLTSIAFGSIAFLASFWTPTLEGKLTNDVLRRMKTTRRAHSKPDIEHGSANKDIEVSEKIEIIHKE